MKRATAAVGVLAVFLGGCASSTSNETAPGRASAPPAAATQPVHRQQAPGDEEIASAGSLVITRQELTEPLIEAYGLQFLVQLLTLESAADAAQRAGLSISESDIQTEVELTIAGMVKDAPKEDHPRLLQTFLTQQQITRTQFDILMKTNAYLRKLADPQVQAAITDEVLRQAFGTMYGENVLVRHIQLTNMHEVAEAQRRLASGEEFAEVARKMSRNVHTAPHGGRMTPFSLQMQGLPDSFKQAAFSLKTGEVSDAVQAEDSYHLIKLEERIAPKAVDYEDHKETVREHVYDNFMLTAMRRMRNALRTDILQRIDIDHPVLARQFKEQTEGAPSEEGEKERIMKDLQRQREQTEAPPAAREPLEATTRAIVPDQVKAAPTTRPAQLNK